MKGIPQGRYMREFQEEAVNLVTEGTMTIPAAAKRFVVAALDIGELAPGK